MTEEFTSIGIKPQTKERLTKFWESVREETIDSYDRLLNEMLNYFEELENEQEKQKQA